ncbi:MAG: hypothetical protein V7668_11425 [Cereibacter changlensis]|uniref:CTP synthetase n=2 Tax=Cereibacter changlensis TaxID=402884 RepID=A0A2T4JSE5_9RHOB|nr:hypothetical protein [Cereibacter changlensis]PTE20796.1 hypothetical protein C5F48_15605 [Cereibacter changlensis JA139]PZX53686.1 hypothetical protein LX76_02325 [Cereibacter changlensis]
MDRLAILLTMLTGAMITGTLVVVFFSMGYYGWGPVIIAVVIGMVGAWPSAWGISRRIKRKDPGWDETQVEKAPSSIPRPGAPEL